LTGFKHFYRLNSKGGLKVEAYEERELVLRASRGDVESYSVLVKKYSNAVYATALSVIRDFHFAQDLAQEVFVKAWFNLNGLEEKDKFGGWLFTITKRMCLDWIRRAKPTEPIDSFPSFTDGRNSVETIVERYYIQEKVWDAINKLDEPKRLVTILYFISGFSSKEISDYLSISVSAVESRIRRSKEKLKKELLEIMEEEFSMKKIGQQFHDDVLWRIVPRIATIEIPVSKLEKSIEWYNKILGTKVVHQSTETAMLHLQGGNRVGVPTLFLVQTDDKMRLSFLNTNTKIVHSVIDFFVPDLERFQLYLQDQGVEVTKINFIPGLDGKGGFGFKDLDGNSLSACNVTHQGQDQ
jgi:RNA polymerase sigma factor (sigma-70 family)